MRISAGLFVLLFAGSLHALPSEDASARARDHFRQGLAAVEKGDLDLALREFEAAYAARPHFSVLYNIGQARLGLGQPLPAVEAFERYLREGAAQVSAERREEVKRLLATSRRRLGELRLLLAAPERTRVWLDGVELRKEQWAQPIPVVAGEHHVLYSLDAGSPTERAVSVERGGSAEVRLEAVSPPRPLAQLSIRCTVPGVSVEVAGLTPLRTPVPSPILVPSGPVTIRFARPGYRPSERSTSLDPGAVNSVDCEIRRADSLASNLQAGLLVRSTPPDAETLVDDEPFLGGALPAGPHTLTIRRDGYVPATRTVTLVSGRTLHQGVELERTPAARSRMDRARDSRRLTGLGFSGAAAALLLTAGALFLWNNQRYEQWEARQATSSTGRNIGSAVSLQRLDDICIGLTVLGAGSGAAGAWFLSTPPRDIP